MAESGKNPRIDVSLLILLDSVRTLQTTLQTKAKNEPATRFYSLWDKVCREDVLFDAIGAAAQTAVRRESIESALRISKNMDETTGWKDCSKS
jgi:hypothetical protein